MNGPTEAPGLDLPCPQCQRLVGDHTIRGYGECMDKLGLNYTIPFEEIPGGPVRMTDSPDQMMVGAIDVLSGVTKTALGHMPILGFRFYAAGAVPGSRIPTPLYLLVGDAQLILGTKELVNKNANAAVRAARDAR